MNIRSIKSWQWALLVIAFLVALDWGIRRPDPMARHLNDLLEAKASPALRNYPFQFQVLRVEGKSAVMTTPRNFDSPAFRFLGLIYPDINVKDHNNPAFIKVEQELGRMQDEARNIVLSEPAVTDVRWELDRNWLRRRGIEVPDK